jgi:hypothetical protein
VSERSFQKAACEYLTMALRPYGGWVGAIPGGDGKMTLAPGYVAGSPDVLVVLRGRPILIELKAPKGTVKKHQKGVHADLTRAGATVYVARSIEDLEEIVKVLKCGVQP